MKKILGDLRLAGNSLMLLPGILYSAPYFRNYQKTSVSGNPSANTAIVWISMYSESKPMIDGVRIWLFAIAWNILSPQLVMQSVLSDPAASGLPPFGMKRDTMLAEARAVAIGAAPAVFNPAAEALVDPFREALGRHNGTLIRQSWYGADNLARLAARLAAGRGDGDSTR